MIGARYDRQIRLWGDEGQTSIQKTRVCVLGSSALASETLKSLVLAGIESFHVVDDELVTPTDLGQNFFVSEAQLGKSRAEAVVELLSELNPQVSGGFSAANAAKFTEADYQQLLNFSIVIGTNLTEDVATRIGSFLYEKSVPFIHTRICGFVGYLRNCIKQHPVWNSHAENAPHDLRLDRPLPELVQFAAETDLAAMKHEVHAHTPYVLLYLKALETWRESVGDPNAFPDIRGNYKQRKEFERLLMEMRMPDEKGVVDEENFSEAKANLIASMGRTEIPAAVREVIEDPKASLQSGALTPATATAFWILASALRVFIERHGQLPLSGRLPDMTSDSKRYARIVGIYQSKARADAQEIYEIAHKHLEQLGLDQAVGSTTKLSLEQCQHFCKHAAKIRLLKGAPMGEGRAKGLEDLLSRITDARLEEPPIYVDPLVWVVLLRALDRFYVEKDRFPGTNGVPCGIDSRDLKQRVLALVQETQNPELIANAEKLVPQEAVDEITRFGMSEPHVIAAILGGTVAQEAIKLATHQYVPVDNGLVYDGHSQCATAFRI